MRYGMCVGFDDFDKIKTVAQIGYDYCEFGFQPIARASDEEIDKIKAVLDECNIKCESTNCFLPSEYNVSAGLKDEAEVAKFIEEGMRKGKKLGLEVCVFGSGGAKRIPEGVSYVTAFNRLTDFLKNIAGPIAEKYGITICIEPLCKKEVNIINTVKEGAMLAAASRSNAVADLADLYHMVEEGDTYQDILDVGEILKHAHISNPSPVNPDLKRAYPVSADEYDYKGFIDTLEAIGCPRCSVEAKLEGDFKEACEKTFKVLKSL